MAKKPNTPCAGGCGKLLWSGGRGSLPVGQRKCRECRTTDMARQPRAVRICPQCGGSFVVRKGHLRQICCSQQCGQRRRMLLNPPPGLIRLDPAERRQRELSRWRQKNYTRRTILRASDITPEWERAFRAKARRCPLCAVRMTDEPFRGNSKELDHIVPINVGGTHTIGNVRIICRDCNVRRPLDGSDYVGPVTLWAQL